MQEVVRRTELRWWILAGPAALLLGVALAYSPDVGFILFGLLCLLGVLAVPPSFLIGAALLSALGLRAMVTFGWVSAIVGFADIPLVWLGLVVALIHPHATTPFARRVLQLVIALLASVALAWIFNPSEVLRPFLYAALLGEPFAIIATFLLAPPSARARKGLVAVVILLLAIQVPIGLYQASALGIGDPVQGTLYGAGAGHHVLGGCAALGIIFCLASRHRAKFLGVAALGVLLFLSDTRQVFVALIPAILVMRLVSPSRFRLLSAFAAAVIAVPALFAIPTATDRWEELQTSETGKKDALQSVTEDLGPASVLFGRGPAETVSRTAFMTTEFHLRSDSPLRAFKLHPAKMATDTLYQALGHGLVGTSVNYPLSSALGVFGDLGLVGFGIIVLLIFTLIRAAWHLPFGAAIIGAWTLWAVLGLIYDWWEQPPFTVLLALLTGLALSTKAPRSATRSERRWQSPR